MASIKPYETAKGRRYRVRYRKPDGSPTDKRGFRTKREADLFAAAVEVTKAKGEFLDPSLARVQLAELAPAWIEKKRLALKVSAFSPLETAWRVWVEPRWADMPISSITPSDVEAWIMDLQRGTAPNASRRPIADGTPRSPTVVIRAVGVLAGILDDAVRDGRLSKNPARGADNLPRKMPKADRIYLTHNQVARLTAAIDDHTRSILVLTLAYTGLRWGEAIALRVRDINMLRRRLQVNRSATQVDGKIVVGSPKSWEARSVAFPAFLAEPIAYLAEGKSSNGLIFEAPAGGFLMRPHTREGRPSWFARALADAELMEMTPHDLRHTAASLAVSSGANVKALQRMLGHKSAAETLDVYADLFDEDLEAVALKLHATASQSDVGKMWAKRLRAS